MNSQFIAIYKYVYWLEFLFPSKIINVEDNLMSQLTKND